MSFSAQDVKELREKTGAGMMDCKKALTEAGGDMEKAVEGLRKAGLAAAAKKSGRVAAEGIASARISDDGRIGVLLELNCETDFVAKNEDFKAFAEVVTSLIQEKSPADVAALSALSLGTETVAERLSNLVAKIGEKQEIRRFARVTAGEGEKIGSYIHLGSKIGVLVKVKGNAPGDIIKDVAMHVAAINPQFVNKNEIPAATLAKEKEIYLDQMKDSGKPANILEKIIDGKLQKFAADISLNEQIFIKDPAGKKSVAQFLKDTDAGLSVVSFVRYQVGEGIEKKADDFAAEVAKMVG